MTAPTTGRAAHPVPLEQLLPAARDLAERLGKVPSRNRLMTDLKVGSTKARTLLAALQQTNPTATAERTPVPAADLVPAAGPTEIGAEPVTVPLIAAPGVSVQVSPVVDPGSNITAGGSAAVQQQVRKPRSWPVALLALPAFVAIWSGWVGLGELTGFGVMHPLPGIWDEFSLNTAITLPVGVETYAAYALAVWLSGRAPHTARRFARWSAIGSLIFGAAGQVAYHLLTAAGVTHAPWWITTAVACLPVAVLGMGAALAHLIHASTDDV